MKRILHTILACLLLVVLIPARAEAATVAEGTCGDNLTWTLDDGGTLTISGAGAMADYKLVAGEDGKPASTAPWILYKDQINKVIMDEDITSIGDYAFFFCAGLTGQLEIPGHTVSIGKSAFRECTGLTGVIISESVTYIGNGAFMDCSGLIGQLVLPDGLTTIDNYTFYGCSGLTTVDLGKVQNIGTHAFYECSGLTGRLVIPDTVISIESEAFSGCTGLSGELVIPDSVTNIGVLAFCRCSGLNGITFGKQVETIGDIGCHSPFHNCSSVREMTFHGTTPPMKLYSDFINLETLKSVYVPALSLSTYEQALSGKLPSGAVIQPIGEPTPPAPSPADLDWFFDRIKEPGNTMWATATYYRIMEAIKN